MNVKQVNRSIDEQGYITLSFRLNHFTASVRLPPGIDEDSVTASCAILKLRLEDQQRLSDRVAAALMGHK